MRYLPQKKSAHALNRIFLLLILAPLLIAATFRTTGLDYPVYLAEFIDPVNELSSREVGYVLLIDLVAKISGFWLVLFIGNITFLCCHLTVLKRTCSIEQTLTFLVYLTFVSLFLIYGSPRRLIAYSLIAYIITAMVFHTQSAKKKLARNVIIIAFASSFHASALVFFPFFIAFTFGINIFKRQVLLPTLIFTVACAWALFSTGALDYLIYKFTYYAVDAAVDPGGYLAEVPSITSGLLKRLVALSLLWIGTRNTPQIRHPSFGLCITEMVLYGVLGALSPVLAVTATYLAIGYMLPILLVKNRPEAITKRRLILLCAASVYFVPTSIGLIRLLGEFYVS